MKERYCMYPLNIYWLSTLYGIDWNTGGHKSSENSYGCWRQCGREGKGRIKRRKPREKNRGMTLVGHRDDLLSFNENMYSILNWTVLKNILCWGNSLYKPNDI